MSDLFRPISFVMGLLILGLAAIMMIPAIVDLGEGNPDWRVFVASGAGAFFIGGLLALANRSRIERFTIRQGFLLTTIAWLVLAAASAVPFILSRLSMSAADGFFESMSGLTTTGATVIEGLDDAPPGILLWRALLQGIGGIGIVVMAVLVLPFLRVGGQQLFSTESSDKSDKPLPRMRQVVGAISTVYFLLILLCAFALWFAGMSGFDAICHALATIATGGFSTKDASLGFYDNAAFDWIIVVFMISGALPLTWYVRIWHKGPKAVTSDSQVRVFLVTLAICIAAVTSWVYATQPYDFWHTLRLAAFNVTSIVTDTGFASTDYMKWGSFAIVCFFFFPFIGGCTGSTAGSIKIFRWQIMMAWLRRLSLKNFQPNRILQARYNGKVVDSEIAFSVFAFFTLYLLTYAAFVTAVSATGVDILSASSAVAACMANSGPGLGDIVGPAGTYKSLPDAAKWLLSFAMLLGRLELYTMLVPMFPDFWRV